MTTVKIPYDERLSFFVGYQGGLKSTGWPHTIQLGEPNYFLASKAQ
jgi:hypothetical protein